MPKLKTVKAFAKRLRVTKNKKIIHRSAGQDHFNSRDTGNQTRKKRRDHAMSETKRKTILRALPYLAGKAPQRKSSEDVTKKN